MVTALYTVVPPIITESCLHHSMLLNVVKNRDIVCSRNVKVAELMIFLVTGENLSDGSQNG